MKFSTKQKYDSAITMAATLGFQVIAVTKALNGFPFPQIGTFIYGFESIDKARLFEEESDGQLYTVSWKDGWHAAHLLGHYYGNGFELTDEDYGDDFFILHSAKDLFRFECTEECIEECKSIDWSEYNVVVRYGEVFDVLKKYPLQYYVDVTHYAIGVFLTNQFHEEDDLEEEDLIED